MRGRGQAAFDCTIGRNGLHLLAEMTCGRGFEAVQGRSQHVAVDLEQW